MFEKTSEVYVQIIDVIEGIIIVVTAKGEVKEKENKDEDEDEK